MSGTGELALLYRWGYLPNDHKNICFHIVNPKLPRKMALVTTDCEKILVAGHDTAASTRDRRYKHPVVIRITAQTGTGNGTRSTISASLGRRVAARPTRSSGTRNFPVRFRLTPPIGTLRARSYVL